MFTGIITAIGHIDKVTALGDTHQHGKSLRIITPAGYLDDVALGDSIALNGACMTVTTFQTTPESSFTVDISAESLQKTAGLNRIGPVNLEKALRAHDRLGGHIVSGHVDGIGTVQALQSVGESWQFVVLAPRSLSKYLAYKGSITVNGASLTVNTIDDTPEGTRISINLIPHTLDNTALGKLLPGDAVNLEIDLIARYVERMLSLTNIPVPPGI